MVKVKVCGITNLKDAQAALEAGADALGFVFAASPRKVTTAQASKIVKALGPWVATVGVFVNETPESMIRTASECGLSCIQLHGDENPLLTKKLSSFKVIKVFRVDERFKQSVMDRYDADAFLLDTKTKDLFGGSGKTFDWKLLDPKKIRRPFILSGGLHPKNVRRAVRALKPYGVDVSSGVERFPGKKDQKLMKEFIQNAKTA